MGLVSRTTNRVNKSDYEGYMHGDQAAATPPGAVDRA